MYFSIFARIKLFVVDQNDVNNHGYYHKYIVVHLYDPTTCDCNLLLIFTCLFTRLNAS